MNWQQLRNASTKEQRLVIALKMLETNEIQSRSFGGIINVNAIWKVGIGRLVKGYHYIGTKQVTYTITPLAIYLINFVSVLAIITTIVLLGSEQMLPAYGVLFMLTFECVLLTTLVIKPWRRWRPNTLT